MRKSSDPTAIPTPTLGDARSTPKNPRRAEFGDGDGPMWVRPELQRWSDEDYARFYDAAELPQDGRHAPPLRGTTDTSRHAPLIFASCHSIWIFDTECMRFRRIPHGVGPAEAVAEWRPYHELVMRSDSASFVVVLNAEGTRMLRSWRHTQDCVQCAGHVTAKTAEPDVDGFRDAVE